MLQIFSAKTIWRSLYLFSLRGYTSNILSEENLKSPLTYFTRGASFETLHWSRLCACKGKSSTSNNLSTFRRSARSALEARDCFSWSRRYARIRSGWTPLSGSERPCAWRCWTTLSLAEAESARIQLPHSAESCGCPPRTEWPCQRIQKHRMMMWGVISFLFLFFFQYTICVSWDETVTSLCYKFSNCLMETCKWQNNKF